MEFPYKGWVLTPTCNPKEVVFVRGGHFTDGYHWTEKKKAYHTTDIHPNKTAAILAGNERVRVQQAALDKSQLAINKRRANLALAAK